jgi:hypothetical protein
MNHFVMIPCYVCGLPEVAEDLTLKMLVDEEGNVKLRNVCRYCLEGYECTGKI